jgi:hypothetical protein
MHTLVDVAEKAVFSYYGIRSGFAHRPTARNLSHTHGIIEHVFENVADGELIDVMGEATRDESTAIAQRLAAVAQLYVRRSGELADCEWWCADACDAVAAEVSAVQNISDARAVGQVQFACALWHRLPRVARVFCSGVIDFRLVSTIISRTENVDDAVMPELDEAIARHCTKWMKLSGPKLRDRVDQSTASTPNAANAPNSSPNKNDNAKPGSPKTMNHHRSDRKSACQAILPSMQVLG